MPSDKPPTVSFNQWIKLQSQAHHTEASRRALSAAWIARRGRLTAGVVAERAEKLGLSREVGEMAWAAYRLDACSHNDPPAPAPASE